MAPLKAEHYFKFLASGLQDELSMLDVLSRRSRGDSRYTPLKSKKLEDLRLTLDGDTNDGRPQIHMDYGEMFQRASFAIDTGERLVGSSPTKYDMQIAEWIRRNRERLLAVATAIRRGTDVHAMVVELKASE